jgi:hypothetical protein
MAYRSQTRESYERFAATYNTLVGPTPPEQQARRGRTGELLDVITDDLGGPYDGVLALCVLIHVPFERTGAVLAKIARALRPGGAFLVSLREGDGETFGAYHTVYWRDASFGPLLPAAGLHVEWQDQSVDSDGDSWLAYLARAATTRRRGTSAASAPSTVGGPA